MLSRIAESLFWIGRYIERSDGTARILDVHLQLLLEDPWIDEDTACRSLLLVMGSIPPESDEVVRRVLTENEPRWESLGEADRERLGAMAKAIASRLLHEPTLRMKRSAGSDEAYLYVSALRELFGLDVETEPDAEGNSNVTELRRSDPGRGSA